ncbi:MAG: hypothetical protein ABII01_00730 [Candidatus Woesearchaeota archaeon]
MEELETVEDMRRTGQQLAVAFRMSDANLTAACTFADWQRNKVNEIGELVEDDDIEKVTEAVTLLGELRTYRAVPYLLRAARLSHPAVTGNQSPEEILFDRITTALFRTECLDGHKEIHRVWKYQNSKWHHGLRNLLVEAYQGEKSNLRWYGWLNFKCDYRVAEKMSDIGCDLFNRKSYLHALMEYSSAVNTYPFFSGFWRQMGDAKVMLAKKGSDKEIVGFRKWWNAKERGDELRDTINFGSYTDYTIASELSPYLPGDLADIGYGFMTANNQTSALTCFDRGLLLATSEDTKAYLFLRRGESNEELIRNVDALHDYRESLRLHELVLEKQRKGSVIRMGFHYDLQEKADDLRTRIEMLS